MNNTEISVKEALSTALLEAIQREVFIYEREGWSELESISVELLPVARLGQSKVTAEVTHVTCKFKEPEHIHNWVSPDNEVLSGVEICVDCLETRVARD